MKIKDNYHLHTYKRWFWDRYCIMFIEILCNMKKNYLDQED